jgi:hypothetical protein
MGKATALFLAGLFAVAVTVPGIAMANCAQHTVSAEKAPITTAKTTPTTPAPETKTGG